MRGVRLDIEISAQRPGALSIRQAAWNVINRAA
jgi:hypothetical protein